nr:hypothetical protein T05F1.12 - Caenorhabditis elegans [Caenorhabditis elegans]
MIFADDIKLLGDNVSAIQKSINVVTDWCAKWKLNLAENKTNVIHFGKRNPKNEYYANGMKVTKKDSVKDLGIFVDDKLNFQKHINIISNLALLKCRQLLRSFRSTNASLYFKLYNIYVQPILNYGCEIYNPISKNMIKQLEFPLKFFSRKVFQRCNLSYSSYENRLAQMNQKSVQHLRILQILRTYHNILSGEYHFPNAASTVRKARSPRYPYMMCPCGSINESFLLVNLHLWNRMSKLLPGTMSRQMFASRLNSIPFNYFSHTT